MNLEFKFDNEIYASVDLVQKTIKAYTREQYDYDLVCQPISYTSDNEMVEALKKVSDMVNLNLHYDVVGAISIHYHPYKDCNIKRSQDGSLVVTASLDRLGNDGNLVNELNELGAEFVGRHLTAKIYRDGTCIAEITYS